MTTSSFRVAVSYAWKEEQGGENAQAVESLCASLARKGFHVLRDKHGVKLGDDLREFMLQIGSSGFLCVFLSDAYLRSANCMRELLIAWDQCQGQPAEFRSRVKVWIMPTAKGILQLPGRVVYINHWKQECDKIRALIREHSDYVSGGEQDDFKLIKQFADKVDDILYFCAKQLSPGEFGEFEVWICSQLPGACPTPGHASSAPRGSGTESTSQTTGSASATGGKPPPLEGNPPPDEARLREVFVNQYDALEAILVRREPLRKMLAARFGIVGKPEAEIARALVAKIQGTFLEAIGIFGMIYEEEAIDRQALLELVSSAMFLAMCPEYADGLLKEPQGEYYEVAEAARVGIAEMLVCWIQHKGRRPVPTKALSQEKAASTFESPPQMALPELKNSLMDRVGIDPKRADADHELEKLLEVRKNFGRPEYQMLNEADRALLDAIKADNSPLRDLLVLIKVKGRTINPTAENKKLDYDGRLETHLGELIKELKSK